MQKSSFTINHYRQDFWVEPEEINAQGDFVNPFLIIPLHLDLRPPNKQTEFILFSIEANICFKGFKNSTSEVFCLSNKDVLVRRTEDNSLHTVEALKFPMKQETLAMIEQYRDGDSHLTMTFKFHYGVYSEYMHQRFICEYATAFSNIYSVSINKSLWVERILPSLGYKAFRLIEIPEESKFLPKEHKQSIAELDAAKKYFLNNDYDKVVAHCRSALEPFTDKMKALKIHLNEEKANYIEKMAVSTNIWLNEITKATKSLSSKTTHHAPSFGHFNKREAEIIYTITVGIIGYIGQME